MNRYHGNNYQYSRDLIMSLKYGIRNDANRNLPLLYNFPLRDKNVRNNQIFRRPRKTRHRGGWQNAIKSKSPDKMSFPIIVSLNVRSLFNKFLELENLLSSNIYTRSCLVCCQETWLTEDIDDNLITPSEYTCHRVDRMFINKTKGGGVATFVRKKWCINSSVIFSYAKDNINCLTVRCRPRNLRNYKSILICNIYIPPSTSNSAVNKFYDEFISLHADFLHESLVFVCGDLNRSSTHSLSLLGFTDHVQTPTRANSQLDHLFVNVNSAYSIKIKAPLSSSDHNVILAMPKIYSKSYFNKFNSTPYHSVKLRCHTDVSFHLLNSYIHSIDFKSFDNGNLDDYVESITLVLERLYNLCCPIEKVHVSPHRISSPQLKMLRRLKEVHSRARNYSQAKILDIEIKKELERLNSIFVEELFRSRKSADIWKGIKRLTGDFHECNGEVGDLNRLNESFITPSDNSFLNHIPNSANNSDFVLFEPQKIQQYLSKLRVNNSTGPDNLPAIVFKKMFPIPCPHCLRHCEQESWKRENS